MEPQTPSSPITSVPPSSPIIPVPSPTTAISNKRNSYLFLILFGLVVVLIAGYFLSQSLAKPKKISGLEVAIKTATFLDKTLQLDGGMIAGYNCYFSSKKCEPMALSATHPHLGQAIYSYALLAKATGDQTFKGKADRAINYVLDGCDTDVRMCEWNFFPLAQYYQETKEDKYLTRGMLRPAEGFLMAHPQALINTNAGHKLASLYQATGDERFKNKLLELAESELKPESASNIPEAYSYAIQVVWSIYIPAYNITQDPKYLTAAKSFFERFDVVQNIDKFKTIQTASIGVKAADALIALSGLDNEKKVAYRSQAHVVLQNILDNQWDTPERKIFNGDYGLIDEAWSPSNSSNENMIHKPTLFNGWVMKLLILLGSEMFQAPVQTK